MHRTITGGLLSVCLTVFLCPAVGKPNNLSWPVEKPAPVVAPVHKSCGIETKGCSKLSKQHGSCCAGHESQNSQSSHCCPAPCSALVLMCSVADKQTFPQF